MDKSAVAAYDVERGDYEEEHERRGACPVLPPVIPMVGLGRSFPAGWDRSRASAINSRGIANLLTPLLSVSCSFQGRYGRRRRTL
jgi:hypothetical protein